MSTLNPIEQEIRDYLNRAPRTFTSVTEISKNVGQRKWFNKDRNWARSILRRLEMEGWVESNPFGEYRLAQRPDDRASFRQALSMPGLALGETTIICEDDGTETLENDEGTDRTLKGNTTC